MQYSLATLLVHGLRSRILAVSPLQNALLLSFYFLFIAGLISNIIISNTLQLHRFCSSLGQNLETSNYVWEKCFAVLISLFGLLLFTYFIGNLQVSLKSYFFKGLGFLLPSYTIMNSTLFRLKQGMGIRLVFRLEE